MDKIKNQLNSIDSSILKTETKIEDLQIKLRNLKADRIKLADSHRLKILNDNNIDINLLQQAIELLNTKSKVDENFNDNFCETEINQENTTNNSKENITDENN